MLGVVGDLVEDVIVWLGEPVQHGTDSKVEIFHTRGGSGANVAGFAAALHPTRFLGCVGDDHVGRFLVDDLEGKGVDVRVQRRGKSGTIVILIDEKGERTMLPQRGASMLLQDVSDDWIDGMELLHVPAYSFDGGPLQRTACDLIRRIKKRGGLVSVDASSTGMLQHFGVDQFLDLMAELGPDFIIANQTEAALLQLSNSGIPGDGLTRLPQTIVVAKSGPEPTVVHIPGGQRLVVPVPPVECVRDLTGAGDAFAAGFLAGYLQTRNLEEACVTGHATAAKVLSSPGASMAEAL